MQVTGTLQNLINKPCWTLYLNWTDKNSKDKEYIVVKVISLVSTAVHFFRPVRSFIGSSYWGVRVVDGKK